MIGASGIRLFGRETEIALLDRLVGRIPERGGALLVRGEPGIGKSALLAAVSSTATSTGISVWRAAGAPSEVELPFAGLHQLLQPAIAWLDRLPQPQRDAVSSAFGATDFSAPDPFLIALAALNLLTYAAERAPLLLVTDEAQWLDPSTAGALAFIARRLDAEPMAMIFGLRDGSSSLLDRAGLPELRLSGLDGASAGDLLDATAPKLTPGERRRVLKLARGNPLALIELPHALRHDDQIEGLSPAEVSLTTRLEQAFLEQASSLPPATRELLLVAAADERASVTQVLAAASQLRGAETPLDTLAPAERAGLIQVVAGSILFQHPLVRSAVYQSAGTSQRSKAHAALAVVLADEPDRRLWHVAASTVGPDESIAREVESLSVRLARRGAVAVAVAAAQRAAALSVDPARRCSRLLMAAELASETGDLELVQRLVREADRLNPDREQRARLIWLRSAAAVNESRDPTELEALVKEAEVAADAGDTELALHLLFGAALRFWRSDFGQEVRDRVARAVESLPVPETHPRRVVVLAMAGPVRWGAAVSKRLGALEESSDQLTADDVYLAGMAARAVGDHRRASEFLGKATAELRSQGRLGVLVQVLVMRGWVAIAQGSWGSSAMLVDESGRLADEVGQTWWRTGSLIARATLAGVRGETETAEGLLVEAEKAAIPQSLNDLICMIAFARGVSWLGAGRPARALEELRRVFDRKDPAFHEAARFMSITYLADAAAQSGQRHVALAILEGLEGLGQETPSPALHTGLTYARPVLAPDDVAAALYDSALRSKLIDFPFDRARLQLAYGAWLRRQRRPAESRAPLRAARQVFDALGCVPWSNRTRRELRAAGEPSRGRLPTAHDRLTSQELQIAQMAATGLSNREIGGQLFLSPRTIASHLYRLFPKLGITSRSQLAGALEANIEDRLA